MHRVSLPPETSATGDMREQTADRMCNGAVDRLSRPQSEELTPRHHDHHQQQQQQLQQKGGYTTSIVVNSSPRQGPVVTVHQRQSSAVTVRHSQSQEVGVGGGGSAQVRQPPGLANTFPRSVSETHEPMYPAVLQKRYSNLAEGKSHRHQNGGGGEGAGAGAASRHHSGVPDGTAGPGQLHHNSRDHTLTTDTVAVPQGGAKTVHAHPHPEHVSPSASRPPSQHHQPPPLSAIPSAPPLTASVFAGRRDVKDPSSVREREIVSSKGTVRGFKNRVRAGIATFWAQAQDTLETANEVPLHCHYVFPEMTVSDISHGHLDQKQILEWMQSRRGRPMDRTFRRLT
ncbi:hypothetical protein Btru_031921 [Bulinus truncatus]|nr:hypothetical protein Btru_031921 [Bulinus truncatus]